MSTVIMRTAIDRRKMSLALLYNIVFDILVGSTKNGEALGLHKVTLRNQ